MQQLNKELYYKQIKMRIFNIDKKINDAQQYSSENWKHLHKVTELSEERMIPSPVIVDYLSRNITLHTNSDEQEKIGLEIGCGFARNILFLLEKNYCQNFIGIDQTETALIKSVIHSEIKELKNRCQFILATAGNIFPFNDESIDFILDVMAASVFITNSKLRKAYFKEISRVLKPGGIFFIFTGNSDGDFYKKSNLCKGSEIGTFHRCIDNLLEKTYTKEELIDLLYPMEPVILEPQSIYVRAFGEQKLYRKEGFWFSVFRKRKIEGMHD